MLASGLSLEQRKKSFLDVVPRQFPGKLSKVGYVADLRIAFASDNADVHFFHSKRRLPVGVKGRSHNVVPWDDWLILADAECRVEKLTSSQLFNNRIVTLATFSTHWKSASKHGYRQTCGNCPSIILTRKKEQKWTIK